MNENRLAGAAENLAGRATAAVGGLLDSESMIARGNARSMSGKLRNVIGPIQEVVGWDLSATDAKRICTSFFSHQL